MKKVLRKSKLVAGILILVVVCLGIVLAGDVIVKEGTIEGEVFKSTGCTADGTKAVAFGEGTTAIGNYSTAMGSATTASGMYSTAMGCETTASNYYSTAMGSATTASGMWSTAMGAYTTASGECSTAMGFDIEASGIASTAMGDHTTAGPADWTTAIGRNFTNNVQESFAVGFGDEDFRVTDDNVYVYGDLDVTQKVTMGTLVLPVKSTTGDPASPIEGQIYVNTADNKVRVYADGAWRDLATW